MALKHYNSYLISTQVENREIYNENVNYKIERFFNTSYDWGTYFYSNGEFSFIVYENDKVIAEAKSQGTDKTGIFLNSEELKEYKTNIRILESGRDTTNATHNLGNTQKIEIGNRIEYYKDFQLLFDKYLYNILYNTIVGDGESDSIQKEIHLIKAINKKELHNAVSKFIADCFFSYSESYENNYSKISEIEEDSGISAELRFDICSNNIEFKNSIANNITLFQMAIDADELKDSNVRGNKKKALMDFLLSVNFDALEEDLDFKLSQHDKRGGLMNDFRYDARKREIRKERKESEIIVSEREKERIEELELEFMNGSSTQETEDEYAKLIDVIEDRISKRLLLYRSANRKSAFHKVIGKINVDNETEKIKNSIDSIRRSQSNNIAYTERHQQNKKLTSKIDKHASFMDEGILYLDYEKQAVINKINEILDMFVVDDNDEDSTLKKSNVIRRFINTDVVNLKEILYRIEAMGGMKKAFAGKNVESARRNFFGEHYKLNNKVELYKLFSTAKKQKVDISRMIFNVLSNYIEEGDIDHETLEKIISNAMNCQGDINSKLDSLYNIIQDKLESNFSKKSFDLAFQTIKTHFEQMDKKEFMQLENTTELQSILNNAEGFLVNKVKAQDVSELKRSMNLMLKETMHDEINSLIDSVDDLFDDNKQNLDLYKLLEYRLKLQDLLSRTQGDSSKEEWVTSAINYVDEKLLNFPVENKNKEKTIYEKDEAAYNSILEFEKSCKACIERLLLNDDNYKDLDDKKNMLLDDIELLEIESGSGGKKEEKIKEKMRELERQIDSIDSKMAAMKKAFDCNYGNELDDALETLAKGLSNSFDSGDSIYVRDSAEKAAAKENRWE